MSRFNIFKRMTLIRTMTAGYVVQLVLLCLVIAAAAYVVTSQRSAADHDRKVREAMIANVANLQLKVHAQVDALRAQVLSATTGGNSLQELGQTQQDTKAAFSAIDKSNLGPDAQKVFSQIQSDMQKFNSAASDVLALTGKGKVQDAAFLLEQTESTAASVLDRELASFTTAENAYLATRLTSSQSSQARIAYAGLAFGAIALVIGVLLTIFMPQSIAHRLRGVIERLAVSTTEMLSVTSQVAAGAVQTATAISEAATTVDEVRQTSLLSSQKATTMSDSAQAADQIAEAGRRAVGETLDGIQRIQDQMAVVADSVVRLSEQTEAVGEIISTSNDLAEQSNLLSVNAAIEAAKASDQGKGFSVVAEEIKNLAMQSKQGVVQVRSILNDIQKATAAAVMAAEQSGKAIEDGAHQATDATQAIESLAEGAAAVAQSSMQILASSQQQLVGMDQITEAMSSIDQASSQNAAGARQMEAEVQHLQELAAAMRAMVDPEFAV
jgi:methyl-accepting chemotaxis protein